MGTAGRAIAKVRRFAESSNSILCNGGRVSGSEKKSAKEKYEKLWRDLFADPSKWLDNRVGKPNTRCPDFKHKQTGESLWLIDVRNPPWVASEIASIAPGRSIGDSFHGVFSRAQKLSGYNKARNYEKTLAEFEYMQQEGVIVDGYVYVHVLHACAALKFLEEGRRIHRQILETGCDLSMHVSSSLVDMYAKCGSIDDAWKVFNRMPTRDVIAWNAMILGCVKCGEGFNALELFQQMQKNGAEPQSRTFVGALNACAGIAALEEGRRIHEHVIRTGFESDVYVGNSLVDMYAKCGSMDEALVVFNEMPARNVISWSAMILGYAKSGQGQKSLELFQQMQQTGIEPNSVTFIGVLNACASIGALEVGSCIHDQVVRSGFEFDVHLCISLVDMYAKCGSIDKARRVFDKMSSRDVVAWTAMIKGYAIHGLAKEAIALFEQMSQAGSKIDDITFICLLSACSHGGLVKEGMQYFGRMWSVYGVSPTQEHYTCMVDLLGRAGHLDDAEAMVKTMPLETCAAMWKSLLGSCRIHGHVEMGERVSRQVMKLDPSDSAGYILLSNIYGGARDWDGKSMVHKHRKEKLVMKQPECTWIEVNNEVHTFILNGSQHPQILKIREELTRLLGHVSEADYMQNTRFASHDPEEGNNVDDLCHHSEKLAIAFGLISTPACAPLRIVKNVRVCGDCHTATKYISRRMRRAITVRDAYRFHHFKDGICSCGDFW